MSATKGEDFATYQLRGKYFTDNRTVVGGSDAGAYNDMIESFAFSTNLIEKCVREITLEEAVHQITEVSAKLGAARARGYP